MLLLRDDALHERHPPQGAQDSICLLAVADDALSRGDGVPPRRHRRNMCSRAGWFQYGDGIEECEEADALTMCGGRPLEKDEVYRIVTKVGDLTNGQSAPFTEYFTAHPEKLPPKGNYLKPLQYVAPEERKTKNEKKALRGKPKNLRK